MADVERKVWGIHSTDDGLFLKQGKMAIGWAEVGDLTKIEDSRDAVKAKVVECYPDAKKGAVPVTTGMLYRFCHEVQIGDYVVFPSKADRMVNIGEVTGEYTFEASEHYPHTRSVKWLKHIPRAAFTQGALYEIGSAMTFFVVKNYSDEFLVALDKGFKPSEASSDPDPIVGATAAEIIEATKDFVLKELSRNLKGFDLEEFVANLLQAMGYWTTVSTHVGDRGIDITAYKDELTPRILVQVKSQDDDIRETTIQSLNGAMREGDYGLFVTLSNYTKNAKKYLENTPIIRGINGTELVDLILKYYNDLDEKYRKMIPLKMVYIPVPGDE